MRYDAVTVFKGGIRSGWWNVGAEGIYFVRLGGRPHPARMEGKSFNYFSLRTGVETKLFGLDKPLFSERPDFCVSPKEDRIIVATVDLENIDSMIENFR